MPPSDASNALVVIWVNNADLYFPALDSSPTLDKFTNVINVALTNQFQAITNLYAKGIRTLLMPNVVDISTVPKFNAYTTQTNLFHQATTNYNAAFYVTLDKARTSCPGLNIVVPDYFGLLTNLLTYPASYGLTNVLVSGRSMDAIDASNYGLPVANTNGYGTNYIFWDPTDPTAKVHYLMAGVAQQLISPVKIGQLTVFPGSNRLDLVNVPVYTNSPLNGLVLVSTNLASANWTTNLAFSTTNTSQSVWATNASPQSFYRLKFPYVWTWP